MYWKVSCYSGSYLLKVPGLSVLSRIKASSKKEMARPRDSRARLWSLSLISDRRSGHFDWSPKRLISLEHVFIAFGHLLLFRLVNVGTTELFLSIYTTGECIDSDSWITSTGLIWQIKVLKDYRLSSTSVNWPTWIWRVAMSKKVTPISCPHFLYASRYLGS